MSTRAIAASGEQAAAADTYVSSNLSADVELYLPKVNDGTGSSVAVDTEIRIETTAGGTILVLTADGRRVGLVPSRTQAVVVARTGAAQSEADDWNFDLLPQTPAAFQTISASPTQAEVTALRDCLVNAGLMKAE